MKADADTHGCFECSVSLRCRRMDGAGRRWISRNDAGDPSRSAGYGEEDDPNGQL